MNFSIEVPDPNGDGSSSKKRITLSWQSPGPDEATASFSSAAAELEAIEAALGTSLYDFALRRRRQELQEQEFALREAALEREAALRLEAARRELAKLYCKEHGPRCPFVLDTFDRPVLVFGREVVLTEAEYDALDILHRADGLKISLAVLNKEAGRDIRKHGLYALEDRLNDLGHGPLVLRHGAKKGYSLKTGRHADPERP